MREHPAHATKAYSHLRRRRQIHWRCAVQCPALTQIYDRATQSPQSNPQRLIPSSKIVLGKHRPPSGRIESRPRLLPLKSEAANPDQWLGPETETPRKYGGCGLCQTLIACVKLYSVQPPTASPLWITHSTVTDFARFLGWSTSVPFNTAT